MAIVSMKKLILVGLISERSKILRTLHKMGCVEISSTKELDNTKNFSDINYKDQLSTKLSKISFTFTFLKDIRLQAVKLSEKYKKLTVKTEPEISDADGKVIEVVNETSKALMSYTAPKKPFSLGLPGITYDAFEQIIAKEDDLFEVITKIDEYNSKLIDIKSNMIRLTSLSEQLQPYLAIDAKFKAFTNTKNTAIMLGLIPNNKVAVIDGIIESFPNAVIEKFISSKNTALVVITELSLRDDILSRLVEADFVQSNFTFDMTASDKYNECLSEKEELERTKEQIIFNIMGYESFIRDLEVLYDYYLLELKKTEADDSFKFTESTFILEGWFPSDAEVGVKKIEDMFTVVAEIRQPLEEEIVPTLTRNNSFVRPYEDITNMYSIPNQKEIDPNPFMAFFYFMFFGIMVSDAGYGIILALITFFIYMKAKPRKGEGKIILIIFWGGISTIIWGIMFGGWFGYSDILGLNWNIPKAVMFDPLANPLAMLGLSLGIGLFQILFGMGIHAVALFREKKYLDAICNTFGWYAIFLGIGAFVLSSLTKISILKTIGLIVALLGLVGILIGGSIGKKGIFSKILGGFANVYSITGFMSDILSYSRLFGLGLATGVVGLVINQLALVAIDLIPAGLGYIIAIPILIGGHIFNIAINTLGAYVHNSRLQYIEFFSKFYTGSGHQFVPFGKNTKYIYIDN